MPSSKGPKWGSLASGFLQGLWGGFMGGEQMKHGRMREEQEHRYREESLRQGRERISLERQRIEGSQIAADPLTQAMLGKKSLTEGEVGWAPEVAERINAGLDLGLNEDQIHKLLMGEKGEPVELPRDRWLTDQLNLIRRWTPEQRTEIEKKDRIEVSPDDLFRLWTEASGTESPNRAWASELEGYRQQMMAPARRGQLSPGTTRAFIQRIQAARGKQGKRYGAEPGMGMGGAEQPSEGGMQPQGMQGQPGMETGGMPPGPPLTRDEKITEDMSATYADYFSMDPQRRNLAAQKIARIKGWVYPTPEMAALFDMTQTPQSRPGQQGQPAPAGPMQGPAQTQRPGSRSSQFPEFDVLDRTIEQSRKNRPSSRPVKYSLHAR